MHLVVAAVNFVDVAPFSFQTLMSVLITMGHALISVSIQKVVIIVSVLLGMNFNLIITIVKVNILFFDH